MSFFWIAVAGIIGSLGIYSLLCLLSDASSGADAVHQRFQREYEQRKQAIGKIVCPQCKWTGNWGDGMSYQEFFAYELHVKHRVRIDKTLVRDSNNLSRESQYKCPMCKSTNWQKV